MSEPFQGFTITLPACTAQEVQRLISLTELVLCYGPDRPGQTQRSGFQAVKSYPPANALEHLAVALNTAGRSLLVRLPARSPHSAPSGPPTQSVGHGQSGTGVGAGGQTTSIGGAV